MSDLAENLGNQQADNVLDRVLGEIPAVSGNYPSVSGKPERAVVEPNQPGTLPPVLTVPNGPVLNTSKVGLPQDYSRMAQRNKANHSLMNLAAQSPNMDRSMGEFHDEYSAYAYVAAYTGMESNYVATHWQAIADRLYPNTGASPKKIVENFRAINTNAKMLLDLNSWYDSLMQGDTSSRTMLEIATRERNLMNTDEFIRLMPQGTLRNWLEERVYDIAEQGPQMRKTMGERVKGTINGATAAAAAAIVAYLSGGTSLLMQAGAAVGAPTIAGGTLGTTGTAAAGAMITAGAKVGGTITSFDSLNRQLRGSAYRSMILRMKDEGLDIDNRTMVQMAQVLGALGAGINTLEINRLFKHFGADKILSKSFGEMLGSDKFLTFLGNSFAERLRGGAGTLLYENIGEIVEEVVDYVGQELFFKAQGSDDTFDITGEEIGTMLLEIVQSTTANTMAYGVGLGTAGATIDATISHQNARNHQAPVLGTEARETFRYLPDVEEAQVTRFADGTIENITIEDEIVNENGAAVFEAVIEHPEIEEYLSPTQQFVRDTFVRNSPEQAILTEALSYVTGRVMSELEGLGEFHHQAIDDGNSRFQRRLAESAPQITADGDVHQIEMANGKELGVVVTIDGDKVVIEYSAAEGSLDGTISGTITSSGSLTLDSTTGDKGLANNLIETISPKTELFDRNVEVSEQYKESYDKMVSYLGKDQETLTQEDSLEMISLVQELKSRLATEDPAPETEVFTKDLPVTKTVAEPYWVTEEVEEMVPETTEEIIDPIEIEIAPLDLEKYREPVVIEEATESSGKISVPQRIADALQRFDAMYASETNPKKARKVLKSRAKLLAAAKAQVEAAASGANVLDSDTEFIDAIADRIQAVDNLYAEYIAEKKRILTGTSVTTINDVIQKQAPKIRFAPAKLWDIVQGIPYNELQDLTVEDVKAIVAKSVNDYKAEVAKVITGRKNVDRDLIKRIDTLLETIYDELPNNFDDVLDTTGDTTGENDGAMAAYASDFDDAARNLSIRINRQYNKAVGITPAQLKAHKARVQKAGEAEPEAATRNAELGREVQAAYLEEYKRLEDLIAIRAEENNNSLYELGAITHDMSRLYEAANAMKQRIEATSQIQKANPIVVDDYTNTLVAVNESFLALYNKVFESMKDIYNRHAKEPFATDMKPSDRRAAIISKYRGELSLEAQDYFDGKNINTETVANIISDRKDIYDKNKSLREHGIKDIAEYISPEAKAEGEIDPASLTQEPQTSPIETPTHAKVTTLVSKKVKKRVRKTRSKQVVTMEPVEVYRATQGVTSAEMEMLDKAITETLSLSTKVADHTTDVIDTIMRIGRMAKSPKMRAFLDDVAKINKFSFQTTREIDNFIAEEGLTPDEATAVIRDQLGDISDMKLGELHELYKRVLAAGKTDVRLTGYKVGGMEIPMVELSKMLINEINGSDTVDEKTQGNQKNRNAILDGIKSLYTSTLNYDLLIEKLPLKGKQSALYKVFYSDINIMSQKKRRFLFEYNREFNAKFSNIPGVKDFNKYYQEVVFDEQGVKISKEELLTLLQHKRNEYNWKFIKKNGLSFDGAIGSTTMPPATSKALIALAESYAPTESDMYVIDNYQDAMDRLYLLANERYSDLYGKPLSKSDFYMRLRPDLGEGRVSYMPTRADPTEEVSLVFDTPNIYERKGTKAPIKLISLGKEFVMTTQGLTDFYYMEKVMTRAEVLINNPGVQNAISKKYDRDMLTYIQSGLVRWADQRMSSDIVDKAFDKARRKWSTSLLTLNPEVAFKQTMSFQLFNTYVDAKYLIHAMFDVGMDFKTQNENLKKWSTNYLTRGDSAGNWDIADTMNAREGKTIIRGSKNFEKVKWAPLRFTDKVTVLTGMTAAIQQVLAEIEQGYFSPIVKSALDIDDAVIGRLTPDQKYSLGVQFADYALERTQPMNTPEHTSYFQRASAISRSMAAFGSFTNQVNNLINRTASAYLRGEQGSGRAFYHTMVMVGLTLPAITGFFDAGRTMAWQKLRGKDDFDESTYWKLFGEAYVQNIFGYMFGVRDLAKGVAQVIKRGGGADTGVDLALFEIADLFLTTGGQALVAMDPNASDKTRENALKNCAINATKAAAYSTGFSYYPLKFATAALERTKE